MIGITNIYKNDGKLLKARLKLMDEFINYRYHIDYMAWIDNKKIDYGIPETIDGDPIYADDNTTIIGYTQIPNPEFKFGEWLTSVTITPAVYDGDILLTPETTTPDHVFVPTEYTDVDLEAYLITLPQYQEHLRNKKEIAKDTMVVDNANIPFQCDGTSINYMSAVTVVATYRMLETVANLKDANGNPVYPELKTVFDTISATPIKWKGADNVQYDITLAKLPETIEVALKEVSSIIGVVQQ